MCIYLAICIFRLHVQLSYESCILYGLYSNYMITFMFIYYIFLFFYLFCSFEIYILTSMCDLMRMCELITRFFRFP